MVDAELKPKPKVSKAKFLLKVEECVFTTVVTLNINVFIAVPVSVNTDNCINIVSMEMGGTRVVERATVFL